jgi:YegS/Rv2252/BmrU family lipid kinase
MEATTQATEREQLPGAGSALIILNPVAGRSSVEEVRRAIDDTFGARGWRFEIVETTAEMAIAPHVERAVREGATLVVAAGGDGTVSEVASCLARSEVPLGILPVGTANVLALELGIPQDIHAACELLAGEHAVRELDLMEANGRFWALQLDVGLNSLMIKETAREAKRKFGRAAYLTTLAQQAMGFQSPRFSMVVDGKRMRPRASDVVVANAGTMGMRPFTWGPNISPSDGALNLCIVKVRGPLDYAKLAWQFMTGRHKPGQNVTYVAVRQQVTIAADTPLPVQADGEVIGETPVTVALLPQALRVVVPQLAPQPDDTTQPAKPAPKPETVPVAQTRTALERALAAVKTPEQADRVIDELEHAAQGKTEPQVAKQTPPPAAEDAADAIKQASAVPKSERPQQVIAEAAQQIAAAEGEDEQQLSEGVLKATNPKVATGVEQPALERERQLLQAALLKRLKPLNAIDAYVFLAINHLPHPPAANALMYALTVIMNRGDGWALLMLARMLANHKRGWRTMVDVLPSLWLTAATVEGPIKQIFRRQRPFIAIVRAIVVGRKPGNFSFPSGHSAAAFAGATLLRRHLPKRYWPALYTLAALVGFSRVYLGAHYPGDVLTGAFSGTVLAEGYRLLLREIGDALD